MTAKRPAWGWIKTSADVPARPLTDVEAQQVFATMAAKREEIAFAYLWEGCECRAQLMIEPMVALGINPGRAWAISVGKQLAVENPARPNTTIKWGNHTAPTVAVEDVEHGVVFIDPALSQTGPLTIVQWAGAMRARSIEVSEIRSRRPRF